VRVKSETWILLRRRRSLVTYLVADGLEGDRCDHYNHEVENPVSTCCQRVCGCADLERDDFGWVSVVFCQCCGQSIVEKKLEHIQPGHSKPADSEEGVENEEEDSLCHTGLGVDVVWVLRHVVVRDCKSSHGQSHARRTKEHERTAADLLDDEDGDE
jgi:hypothetical protein